MLHRILVALDQSVHSEMVFDEALKLATAMNARLMLVHVIPPFDAVLDTPVFPFPDGVYPSIYAKTIENRMMSWEVLEQEGIAYLRSLVEQAMAAGVTVEYTQPLGNIGSTLCQLARTWEADLVVIGRRGLSGLSELMMGSVSNYVVHHAPCSVLTVQPTTNAPTATPPSEEAIGV